MNNYGNNGYNNYNGNQSNYNSNQGGYSSGTGMNNNNNYGNEGYGNNGGNQYGGGSNMMGGGNNMQHNNGQKEDYLDKFVDMAEKKIGQATGHHVDPKKYRAQNEKFTDKLRGFFEKQTGKKVCLVITLPNIG